MRATICVSICFLFLSIFVMKLDPFSDFAETVSLLVTAPQAPRLLMKHLVQSHGPASSNHACWPVVHVALPGFQGRVQLA